ncbi:MAG: hypothetical protein ACOY5V_10610 [Pseudomonadota bacterium]
MSTDPRSACVDLKTPHRGLACRLWAHARANRWRFTVSVRDRGGNVLLFATGGLDDAAPRVDSKDDGSHSLWLASACIELRGAADALAAERFIAQHTPAGERRAPGAAGVRPPPLTDYAPLAQNA